MPNTFAGHPTSGAIGFACVSRSARVPVILEDRRRGGWPKSALQPGKLAPLTGRVPAETKRWLEEGALRVQAVV